VHKFEVLEDVIFKPAPLYKLKWTAILGAMGLGFCLSLLFFMDQNIAGAMVNSSDNR
jgi:solute carrier family 4 (sodium borate transporter), member 11